tara:strand:+ start:145 stop:342 length:198 start_codon:yes stop_codon:yes gene_type:complete
MKIGDLVEYIDSWGELLDPRELGTITGEAPDDWSQKEWYVVWHTAGNEGWWGTSHLKVVSEYEAG